MSCCREIQLLEKKFAGREEEGGGESEGMMHLMLCWSAEITLWGCELHKVALLVELPGASPVRAVTTPTDVVVSVPEHRRRRQSGVGDSSGAATIVIEGNGSSGGTGGGSSGSSGSGGGGGHGGGGDVRVRTSPSSASEVCLELARHLFQCCVHIAGKGGRKRLT